MKRTFAALILMTLATGVAIAQDATPDPEPVGETLFLSMVQEPTPVPDERGNVMYKVQRDRMGDHEAGMKMRMPGPPMPPGMPGMGAWWKNSEIAKDLNLTDAQKKQLEQTFLDYRLKLIDLNADLERQELKLEPLVDADSPDVNAISTQLDQVVAARGRLEKSNALMSVSMRKVLNPDQWKKLQGMHRMRVNFAPRAPGLPRSPRPMIAPAPAAAPEVPRTPPAGKEPI
jgi:Spy/CpxP family protein refolding chaperone